LCRFWVFRRERERGVVGEKISSSPAAHPEEEGAQCRSKRHCFVFFFLFFEEKNEFEEYPKNGL